MSELIWREWIFEPLFYERGGAVVSRLHWVETLFLEYMLPLLKQNKFQFIMKPDKIIRSFLWFWRHLYVCGYDKSDPIAEPAGSIRPLHEYKDIFNHILNYSVFEHLPEHMAASGGAFDDTYLGRRLLAELPNFMWSYIDVANSDVFIKHDRVYAEIEEAYKQLEEGDMSLEELDRRRMMKNKGYDLDYVYDKHA